MIDLRIVGRSIAQLRRRMSLTQTKLADALHVSHQAVSKWEHGAALPDVQTLLDMCRLFGVSMEELLTGQILETA